MALKAPTPYTRADSVEEVQRKQALMIQSLEKRPMTTPQLAGVIGNSENLALRYLKDIEETGLIERIPNSYYWRRKDWHYEVDLINGQIGQIARVFFRDIPVIQPWFRWAIGKENAMRLVGIFENICYGDVVKAFKINPSKWEHPSTTRLFYDAYKDQYKAEPKESVVKALRAFLSICLHINIQRGNSMENKMMGLQVEAPKGQYAYIKMSEAELEKALTWLSGPESKEIIESAGLLQDKVQAHFAYALEGFPRPSRVLTVEVDRVEKYRDSGNNLVLHWMQIETKQNKYYPKFMKHPQLVKWAESWLERRRTLNYRYLFIDNNSYQIKKNDSNELQSEREPLVAIYKKMFEFIGKKEAYFYSDTLYALRHCGVHLWLSRTGYNYDMVGWMGWANTQTLKEFYGGLGNKDLLRFVLNGAL